MVSHIIYYVPKMSKSLSFGLWSLSSRQHFCYIISSSDPTLVFTCHPLLHGCFFLGYLRSLKKNPMSITSSSLHSFFFFIQSKYIYIHSLSRDRAASSDLIFSLFMVEFDNKSLRIQMILLTQYYST